MRNVRELVMKAKQENLNNDDIAYVVKKLEECKSTPDDDLYLYIYILGRGMYGKPIPPAYKKLVEQFLYFPQDSSVSDIALDVLCDYWGFVDEYIDVLKQFIRGVDWDTFNHVLGTAIINAGLYLKKKFDKELLSMLLEIFEKSNKDDESEDFKRLLAYCALGLAQGLDWSVLPPYTERLSTLEAKGLIDHGVIIKAYELLKGS